MGFALGPSPRGKALVASEGFSLLTSICGERAKRRVPHFWPPLPEVGIFVADESKTRGAELTTTESPSCGRICGYAAPS